MPDAFPLDYYVSYREDEAYAAAKHYQSAEGKEKKDVSTLEYLGYGKGIDVKGVKAQ